MMEMQFGRIADMDLNTSNTELDPLDLTERIMSCVTTGGSQCRSVQRAANRRHVLKIPADFTSF